MGTQSTWGESPAPRRPTHDTSTSRREVKITHTHTHKTQTYKYTMKITGLIASTMLLLRASAPSGLLASPENGDFSIDVLDHLLDPYGRDWSFGLPDDIKELLLSEALGNLRQDVPAPHGRKLALIPLADLADIGLGVQKIFNPTNGQVNSNDVRGLANTLQKYLLSFSSYWKTGIKGRRIQQETHWWEANWTHTNQGRRWRRRGRTLKAQVIELFRFTLLNIDPMN